jgi:hypothetical protein
MSFTSRQRIRDASRAPPRRLGRVTRVPPSSSRLGRVCPPRRLGRVRPAPSSVTPLTRTPLVSVARALSSWTIGLSYVLST